MNALRQIITTKTQMTTLRDTIRNTFTTGQTAQFLTNIVTDPKINAILNNAIGSKQDKPLKSRQADTITAQMLGFHNANEMIAFYNSQRHFVREQYLHKNNYEDTTYDIFVEEGVSFSPLDAIALLDHDFELERDEAYNWMSTDNQSVTLESIPDNFDYISASDNVSGIIFDLMPHYFKADMHYPLMDENNTEIVLERVEECVNYAGTGRSFVYKNELHLNCYDDCEFEVFSLPQAAMSSKVQFILYFSNLLIDYGKENELIPEALTLPSDAQISGSKGTIALNDGHEMVYDLKRALIVLTKNKQPLIGAGLYLTASDVRGKSLRKLID